MSDFITNNFEPTSAAAWKQKLQFELNGADFNKTLLTKTNEGITIKPFYHLDDFEKLEIPSTSEEVKICQKIKITSERAANKKAINIIRNGADALKFEAKKVFDIDEIFRNLLNKQIHFHFQLDFLNEDFLNKLATKLKSETVYFNIDIIGHLALTGNWHTSLTNDFKILENLLQKNHTSFIISVNASIYQNAGANTTQQIAYALAHANEYLNKFGGKLASKIQFNFATGSNYFFEISKIRAFKYLYNLITTSYNCSAIAKTYSEPSLRNKTLHNHKVNELRTTTENLSSILGGAKTIAKHSHNTLFHSENNSNLKQLQATKDSVNFLNTEDIVSDSYYIESITKQMTEKALDIFKDIEKAGGFLSQLKSGTIQRKIKENAIKEQEQFKTKELVLIGTNKYINPKRSDLKTTIFQQKKPYKTLIIPISPTRLAEKLEQKNFNHEA